MRPRPFRLTVRRMMVLVALTVPPLLFVRLAADAREAARHAQCVGNLKQLGLAFHNYHSTYGHWPPAYVADAAGKPMQSWRVLLLPFMEQTMLYNLYNFTEPWDSPNNRRLIGMMPQGYACPTHRDSASGLTDYFVIVGPATAFPGSRSTTLAEIKDGPNDTLMLVEASKLSVPWTQPQDLKTSAMSFILNDPRAPSPSSWHSYGVDAVLTDGSCRTLCFGMSPDRVKAMSTINGNDGLTIDPRE